MPLAVVDMQIIGSQFLSTLYSCQMRRRAILLKDARNPKWF